MVSKRLAVVLTSVALGCGGPAAAVKPDPPLDDAKIRELSVKNLQSPDPVQRMLAAIELGNQGQAAKDHLAELKKLEKDSDETVRNAVKEAIAKIEKGG